MVIFDRLALSYLKCEETEIIKRYANVENNDLLSIFQRFACMRALRYNLYKM